MSYNQQYYVCIATDPCSILQSLLWGQQFLSLMTDRLPGWVALATAETEALLTLTSTWSSPVDVHHVTIETVTIETGCYNKDLILRELVEIFPVDAAYVAYMTSNWLATLL